MKKTIYTNNIEVRSQTERINIIYELSYEKVIQIEKSNEEV